MKPELSQSKLTTLAVILLAGLCLAHQRLEKDLWAIEPPRRGPAQCQILFSILEPIAQPVRGYLTKKKQLFDEKLGTYSLRLANKLNGIPNHEVLTSTKYAKLPSALRYALELRDVFTPTIIRLEARAQDVTPEMIPALIHTIEQEKLSIDSAQYGVGILASSKIPKGSETFAQEMELQIGTRFTPNPEEPGSYLSSFTGRFTKFSSSIPAHPENDPAFRLLKSTSFSMGTWTAVNPIGEYGPKLTKSLILTQEIMRGLIFKEFEKDSPRIYQANQGVLYHHSARGHLDGKLGPLTALQEGLTSINQTINLLMADKIPGIDDYRTALRKIVLPSDQAQHKGLMTSFVERLPLAVVGPAAFGGKYFPRSVLNDQGSLKLSPDLLESLKRMRKAHQDLIERKGGLGPTTGLGVGCPVVHTKAYEDAKSGMQHFLETYLRIFEMVDAHLNPK